MRVEYASKPSPWANQRSPNHSDKASCTTAWPMRKTATVVGSERSG